MPRRQAPPAGGNGSRGLAVQIARQPRPVFVVHGHDDASREGTARCLERLGLTPVILHEQANSGRTIIEKLERYTNVEFAVVLLTSDDVGAAAATPDALQPRARQNVVLELGMMVAKLGRSRVCVLYKGPLELPSDIHGITYIPLDDAGGWRLRLARELKEAGFELNLDGVLSL